MGVGLDDARLTYVPMEKSDGMPSDKPLIQIALKGGRIALWTHPWLSQELVRKLLGKVLRDQQPIGGGDDRG